MSATDASKRARRANYVYDNEQHDNNIAPVADDAPSSAAEVRARILRRILTEVRANGWRRCGRFIYEQITVPATRGDGLYHTRAYRRRCTIASLVYTMPDPTSDADGFALYAAGGRRALGDVYRLLMCTRCEASFPTLRRARSQWSFANGVYDAADDVFWPYDDVQAYRYADSPWMRRTASCAYVDAPFTTDDISSSDVPALDMIFDRQRLSAAAREFVWTMIGRTLHAPGAYDTWHNVTTRIVGCAVDAQIVADAIDRLRPCNRHALCIAATDAAAPVRRAIGSERAVCVYTARERSASITFTPANAKVFEVQFDVNVRRDVAGPYRAAFALCVDNDAANILVKANRVYWRNAERFDDPAQILAQPPVVRAVGTAVVADESLCANGVDDDDDDDDDDCSTDGSESGDCSSQTTSKGEGDGDDGDISASTTACTSDSSSSSSNNSSSSTCSSDNDDDDDFSAAIRPSWRTRVSYNRA